MDDKSEFHEYCKELISKWVSTDAGERFLYWLKRNDRVVFEHLARVNSTMNSLINYLNTKFETEK